MDISDASSARHGSGLLERTESMLAPDIDIVDVDDVAETGEPSESFIYKMAELHDLSVELSLAEGIDDLCERAIRLGRPVLGFDRIGIWLVDSEDPGLLRGSFFVDESGCLMDKRGARLQRSVRALSADFYEGKEPVYYLGQAPCFDDRMTLLGEADKAVALLWNGRKVLGEVTVDNVVTKRPIGGGELDLLVRYARMVGFLASFKQEQSELERLSGIDELTGVVNRRTALLFLEKQLGLCARSGSPLSVVFVDLDGLKSVNDRFGHAEGDEYIQAACEVLAKALRNTDIVGRLGGDEFLAVMPGCDKEGVEAIGARARSLVEEWNGSGGRPYAMSLSMGFAMSSELLETGTERAATALVELADSRMYAEKISRKACRPRAS
jgi:diguanylate cyclase (GGDEF)-like protein